MTGALPGHVPGSAGTQRLRRDASLVAVGQLLAVASGFLLTLVGARTLPAAEFGALSWALSWLAFLSVVAQLGLTQVATVSFARAGVAAPRRLLRRLLVAQALAVTGVLLLWAGVGPAAAAAGTPSSVYQGLVLVVALGLPVAAAGPVVVNALRARARFGLAVVFGEHVRRVLIVVLLGLAVLTAQPLEVTLAAAVGLETAVYAAATFLLVRELGVDRGAAADPGPAAGDRSRDLLRAGSGFVAAAVASATVPQAGIWLLATAADAEEVAVLSVAVRVALLLGTPTAVVMRTLAPRIVAAHQSSRLAALQEPIRRAAVWSTTATVLGALALAATGSALLPALFGTGYEAALVPALILAAGVVVNAWTGPCSAVLLHAGRQRTVSRNALASSAAFVGLALWWAPLWGAEGVAAAAALAMSARNVHLAVVVTRVLGLRTIAAPGGRRR